MISQIKGKLESISGSVATVDVNGVGYEVYATRQCLAKCALDENITVVIYTEVKENLIRLHGFADELEKQVFLLLMKVKGIGARTAAEIVSAIDKRELIRIIASGNTNQLNAIKGIGKKTAERIVLELRDRIGEYVLERSSSGGLGMEVEIVQPAEEALEALQSLGFSRKDSQVALDQLLKHMDISGLDAGGIVKEALRYT